MAQYRYGSILKKTHDQKDRVQGDDTQVMDIFGFVAPT